MSVQKPRAMARQRKILNLVIAGSLLGAVIGLAPVMKSRFSAAPAPAQKRIVAATPARLPGLTGTAESDRRLQQLAIMRDELLDRERRVAAHEAALQAKLLSSFWKRQAIAAGFTILLSVLTVSYLLRQGIGWSRLRERLRAEETRLRKIQLSVIGALQELETTILAVRPEPVEQSAARGEAAPATPGMVPEPASPMASREPGIAPHSAWAERLVARDGLGGKATVRAGREGPGMESVRRVSLPEVPRELSAPVTPGSRQVPRVRAQVEYLAARGFSEAEIAKHLRLSREEVRLSITLDQGSRDGLSEVSARPHRQGIVG